MELPVVVTDAEGLRENIEEKVTGLVAKRWDVQDLALKLEMLIINPNLCKTLGKNGRKRVLQNFRIENQIESFEKMYYSLISKDIQ